MSAATGRRPGRALGAALLGFSALAADLAGQAGDPQVYEVDGVRVVHLEARSREVAAVRLYLLGGTRQLTPETAGVERLILAASERGTGGFPGDSLRFAQARTGGRFFTSVGPDWSVIGFTGLAQELESSWAILVDRVARPELEPAQVEIVRNQALTFVRAGADDPDAMVRRVAERIAYENHPYAVDPLGTEASLTALTLEDLKAYHSGQFMRSRMLLSIVGPADRPTVERLVREGLGALPLGSYVWSPPPLWSQNEARVTVEPRSLPTNYIRGYFAGPAATDPGYPAFQVAVTILSGYVSSEIRERGLSYAAGASLIERAASGGFVHVSTVNPGASLEVINDAIEFFSENTIQRSIFRDYAEDSALDYYLSNQSSAQQADFLASSLLLRGRLQSVVGWVEDLRGVSGPDVRRAFRNYVRNIQYAYLGSEMAAPREEMLER
ncbi:MAG TPA: pitrilysin family protein [Longimicrobiales bacterium]|nr:pitrilysin family protein [Longimicrobiales bacterium]